MEIYVDGDACPVKDEVMRVAARHSLKVHMVSNSWMRLEQSPLLNLVVVDEGPDVADDWIVEKICPDDICVTADIPLAARCLDKGAHVSGPTGKLFTNESIGMALAMRGLNSHLRETGESRGLNPVFTKKDRSRFLCTLEETIQLVYRQSG